MGLKHLNIWYSTVLQKTNKKKNLRLHDLSKESSTKAKFLPYIHHLRGPAILFVVGVHARGGIADWVSNPQTHRIVQTIFEAVEGNGTTMFVFIAGFLFQHLTHSYLDFRKYIEKRFQYIILPYVVISIPIIIFRIYSNFESPALPTAFNDHSAVYQFFYYLFFGLHLSPFWFISMITLFYLSAPLLHGFDKKGFYRYVFPVILFAGLFTYRPQYNANPVLAYLHLLPVYVMGMWSCANKEKIFSSARALFFPLLFIYIIISTLDVLGLTGLSKTLTFEQVLDEKILVFNLYLFRTLVLCFIFLIIFYWLRDKRIQILERIGDYTLGIYFVHFIIIILSRKIVTALGFTVDFSLFTYLIFFLFVLVASMATVFLIKKLAGNYSRAVIGY